VHYTFNQNSRILIVGTSGSGKSTLARKLSAILKIKDIELDALFWKADWVQSDLEEFRNKVKAAIQGVPGFVMHGNYSKIRDLTWGAVDTVIWLDYSRFVVMTRVLKRTLWRILTREELWSGNRETFRNSFLAKDAIVWWAWNTYKIRKTQYNELLKDNKYNINNIIIINKTYEINILLNAIKNNII
jgi:adenylate kinase family enzyme